AVVVDVEQMLLRQVPAAGTQSDGRLVVIADTGQLAADGAVEVELTADDIGPGRARGVFEVGQPPLGLGVQGSHDFGFGHGTGEFDAAVLEAGRSGGAGDGPGPVGPDAGGLGLEPRQGPAVHLGRTGPARAQQLADGAGELVVQSCDERQGGLREDGAEAGFERRVDRDVRHGLPLTRRSVLPGTSGGAAWNLCAWRAGGPPGAVLGPGSDPDRGSCSRVCGVTARTDNANPAKTLPIRAESVVAED